MVIKDPSFWYHDRTLSAKTADRPDFQRMIADSARGLFDVVLMWKSDRYDSAYYKHVLKKNGVRLISIRRRASSWK